MAGSAGGTSPGGSGGRAGGTAGRSPVDVTGFGSLAPSADGHRLESDGQPFFWLADTQYLIFHQGTHATATRTLDVRKSQGFNVIKCYDNVNGDYTSLMWNGSALNEDYIKEHVDFVVDEIEKREMYLVIVLHESSPVELARALMQRYKDRKSVLWWVLQSGMSEYIAAIGDIVGPKALAGSYIYEGDQSQGWRRVYTAVGGADAKRLYPLSPARPVLMADGMYDADSGVGGSDGFDGAFNRSPFGVRRGAWATFVFGGFFTYGHPLTWGYPSDLDNQLQSESVGYLSRFKSYWLGKAWDKLSPNPNVVSSVSSSDDVTRDYTGALTSRDGDALFVYFPGAGSAVVSLSSMNADRVSAQWFNPRGGDGAAAGRYARTESPTFRVPDGWEDALLEITPQ